MDAQNQLEQRLQQEAASKTRKELQTYLKSVGRSAIGTNAVLQKAYIETRRGEASAASLAVPPASSTSPIVASIPPATAAAAAANTSQQTPVGPKKKAPPKSNPSPAEKRLRRFRPKCPAAVTQRIARARSQRLYLIERNHVSDTDWKFAVLGSTGNVYNVNICHLPSCSCPDHAKGNVCKHILFVWIKVMGLDKKSPLIYQNALLTSELQEAFQQMSERVSQVGGGGGGVLANDRVRKTYQTLNSPLAKADNNDDDDDDDDDDSKIKRQPIEGDCPICFEELQGNLVFCQTACGANFHADCISKWKCNSRGGNVTCPNCRSEWVDEAAAAAGSKNKGYSSPEGYTNLGRLQGQSAQRDTSTYSEWYGYHRRGYKRRRR